MNAQLCVLSLFLQINDDQAVMNLVNDCFRNKFKTPTTPSRLLAYYSTWHPAKSSTWRVARVALVIDAKSPSAAKAWVHGVVRTSQFDHPDMMCGDLDDSNILMGYTVESPGSILYTGSESNNEEMHELVAKAPSDEAIDLAIRRQEILGRHFLEFSVLAAEHLLVPHTDEYTAAANAFADELLERGVQ